MPSLREKLEYLDRIARERPLTRADYEYASSLVYGGRPNSDLYPRSVTARPAGQRAPESKSQISRASNPRKFSDGEVKVIREIHKLGADYENLSDWLGIAKSTVCHVVAGKGAYRETRNFATDY
jgi:hypothetical protein